MAREHARVKLSIWEDDDFRGLTADAQHLYFLLLTSLKLDYCGVTDWRAGRIAKLVKDWTPADVERAAQELSEALYIVIDEESEEVLIRSFIRNDGLMEQPNLAVAMRKAHGAIASSALRAVVIHELCRLHKKYPDLKGWPKVSELLDRPSIDPSDYPSFRASVDPSENPSDDPSVDPSDQVSVTPEPMPPQDPSDDPSPTTAPTPATSPAPNSTSSETRTTTRRTKVRADWKPNEADVTWQRAEGIPDTVARRELPIFVDYWTGKGEPMANWSATWRNWLRRTMQREPSAATAGRPAGWEFG